MKSRFEIIADIFGITSNGVKELGLVDAEDTEDFTVQLESLKDCWNALELSSRPSTSAGLPQHKFHEWFKKNKASDMIKTMIKPVRQKAGLGESPPPFYTNLSESLNRHLKRKVDQKQSGLMAFVEHMRELAHLQQSQAVKAIIRKGSWRFNEHFTNLEVSSDLWFITYYSKQDRKRLISKVLSTDLSHARLGGHSIQSEMPDLSDLPQPTLSEIVDDEVSKDGAGPSHSSDDIPLSIPFSALQEGNIHP